MATPKTFPEANQVLKRPEGMTEEECEDLPVWTDEHRCLSMWTLTLRERFAALIWGRVWVCIYFGGNTPPLWAASMKTCFDKPGRIRRFVNRFRGMHPDSEKTTGEDNA